MIAKTKNKDKDIEENQKRKNKIKDFLHSFKAPSTSSPTATDQVNSSFPFIDNLISLSM
jgi:phosphopantetheine adenylyltransferase